MLILFDLSDCVMLFPVVVIPGALSSFVTLRAEADTTEVWIDGLDYEDSELPTKTTQITVTVSPISNQIDICTLIFQKTNL